MRILSWPMVLCTICLASVIGMAQTGQFITPLDYDAWRLIDDFDSCSNYRIAQQDLPPFSQEDIGQRYYLDESIEEDKNLILSLNDIVAYRKVLSGATFALHGRDDIRQLQVERLRQDNPNTTMDDYQNNCLGVRIDYPQDTKMTVLVKPFKPYELTGLAKYVRVWILGRGDGFQVDLWIRDYTGTLHVVPVTRTDFVGWKLCEVAIPPTIPQSYMPYPDRKALFIEGFAVSNIEGENARTFYIYFDQLELRSDTFLPWFDGQNIPDGW